MTTSNTLALHGTAGGWLPRIAQTLRALWRTDRRLVGFALLMLAALLPAALGLAFDDRELRGVNVWVKPMKFMLSVALLALTTAWFARHLPAAVRQGRAYTALGWTLIASGGFEVGYITLQAALGQASHYNVGNAFHGVMYTLMGAGAIALTATQPWLAWLLWRHGEPLPRAYMQAVLLGLVLTFVLGAGAGILLGERQPPTGPGLPLLGWSMVGGDLRVAHFVGIHAEQALPLLAAGLLSWRPRIAAAGVWAGTAALTTLWAAVLVQALQGRPLLAS